jgi:hypothetical protein
MEQPYGRRLPRDGRVGIYLSLWINVQDLSTLDHLADRWGTTRSATLKRAINESALRVRRKLDPVDNQ